MNCKSNKEEEKKTEPILHNFDHDLKLLLKFFQSLNQLRFQASIIMEGCSKYRKENAAYEKEACPDENRITEFVDLKNCNLKT